MVLLFAGQVGDSHCIIILFNDPPKDWLRLAYTMEGLLMIPSCCSSRCSGCSVKVRILTQP